MEINIKKIAKKDKKEGEGIMKYKNADEYNGEWKKDKKEGKEIMK